MNKINETNLPSNNTLERIVLGLVLSSPIASEYILEHAPQDSFLNADHGLIYDSCIKLHESGESTFVKDVCLHMKILGNIDKVGGESYLNGLELNARGGLAYKTYCSEFIEVYKQRSIKLLLHGSLTSKIPFGESAEFLDGMDEKISLIKNLGKKVSHETFEGLIEGTNPSMGEKTLREYLEDRQKKYLKLKPGERLLDGYSTGFKRLDDITLGLAGGSLNIFGARPGVGKTVLALNIATHLCNIGVPVLFFQLEMQPLATLMRILSANEGRSLNNITSGDLSIQEIDNWEKAAEKFKNSGFDLVATGTKTINEIVQKSVDWKKGKKDGIIMIDYVQKIVPSSSMKNHTVNDQITEICAQLKNLCLKLDVPMLCLAQLNRGIEKRECKVPTASDLRSSGGIEQDADLVGIIHRPDKYNPDDMPGFAEIHIVKNRKNHEGKIILRHDLENFKFLDNNIRLPGDEYGE